MQVQATGVQVRAMTPHDWPAVREIYLEGIATRAATFETSAPEWEDWDRDHLTAHRWVAEPGSAEPGSAEPGSAEPGIAEPGSAEPGSSDAVLGWVACSPVSSRCVYAGVLEVSVYVAAAARGRGVGSALLAAVIASTEADGVWTLQSGIFPHNAASIALHERHGFRTVGTRERLGRLDGTWLDVVLLERRSAVVGA